MNQRLPRAAYNAEGRNLLSSKEEICSRCLPLRRFLPFAGFVLLGEPSFEFGVAEEALRVGPVVLLAPVPLLLEVGGDFGTALCADVLGDAVLGAPPASMLVAGRFRPMLASVLMAVPVIMILLRGGFCAAAAEGEDCDKTDHRDHCEMPLHFRLLD